MSQDERKAGFSAVDTIVPDTFKAIEEAFQSKDDVTGLRSGFAEMDRRTGGLQKSDLIVLAARPSMGKTALCLNIAQNAAIEKTVRGNHWNDPHDAAVRIIKRSSSSSSTINTRMFFNLPVSLSWRPASSSETASLITRRKHAPLPEVLFSWRSPPMSPARRFAMARPSPVPP